MELQVIKNNSLKEKPDFTKLIFGKNMSDYMFTMHHNTEQGWHKAQS